MTTDVARRDPLHEIVATLDRPEYRRQLADMLPPGVSLDRFVRTGKLAVQRQPELVAADRKSLFIALVQCAASGLLPDGRESALVTVKVKGRETVQWWPMIGGLRKKAAEHGITLAAAVIHANDEFSYSTMPPRVFHTPAALGEERGQPIGVFAAALDSDGRLICPPVVMDVAEVEKVRATSRAATSEYGPWVRWWDRMACKTAARRLFAEMPLVGDARDELDRQLSADESGQVDEATAAVPALANLPDVDVGDEVVDGEIEDDH